MAASSAAGKQHAPKNGDPEPGGQGTSHKLLEHLADYKGIILVSHVHPDPDSLGSMLGLAYLFKKKLKKNKKYYVRVRSYKVTKVNNKSKNVYSAWSAKKALKTKKK